MQAKDTQLLADALAIRLEAERRAGELLMRRALALAARLAAAARRERDMAEPATTDDTTTQPDEIFRRSAATRSILAEGSEAQ